MSGEVLIIPVSVSRQGILLACLHLKTDFFFEKSQTLKLVIF